MNFDRNSQNDDFDSAESKTQRKKRMTELQDIGEQLLTLNERQLAQIELPDRLHAALKEYQRLPNRHEAQRRQRQFIGKLMRGSDHESIREALERLLSPSHDQTRRSQEIERWAARLLEGDEDDIQTFLEDYPAAERQPLRNLVRRYQSAASEAAVSAETAVSGETPLNIEPSDDDNDSAQPPAPASSTMISARRRLLDYIKDSIPR